MMRFLSICALLTVTTSMPGVAQTNGSGFVGTWCAQGDPARHASIAQVDLGLRLTNEQGSTSDGQIVNDNTIVALGWNLVQGTLSPDGTRINWGNNTFWARCSISRYMNVSGTWFRGGDSSATCSIVQSGPTLQLQNERGQFGKGSFDSRRHVVTNWSGTRIGGTVSWDGSRID